MERSYKVSFGSQKNNLMGPFGNVSGTFCVCCDRLDVDSRLS